MAGRAVQRRVGDPEWEPGTDARRNVERVGEGRTLASVVTAMQRSVGNQAVTRMLGRTTRDGRHRADTSKAVSRPPVVQRQGAEVVVSRDDVTRSSMSETTDTGNKYTQDLVLNKTHPSIMVQLGVAWAKQGTWASDVAYKAFIRSVKTAAYAYLDNKFKIVCTPTAPGAGQAPIELPITFIIYDYDSGYPIQAHGGTPGGDSAMAQAGGNLYEYASATDIEEAITFAHEFGHALLGVSDEYANPTMPGRVLTEDHSIMANYYAQGKSEAQFKARHFQHIVTEVAKAFAGYTCSLRAM